MLILLVNSIMENDIVADKLYNLLGVKFNNTDIKTLDSTGKETVVMEEIKMFSFDFLVNSRNYGPVVILLSSESKLEVYYGDNTSKSLDRNAKKKWENLIEHLSTFSRANRLGFSLKHTTDLKYDLSNITDITESYRNIFEGYYGTRKTSYSPQGKAKIIIKHSQAIGEDDKRFRNISQIFIENADGERFKLPFKKLTGARAMARHVTEGGNPYDLFGVHICEMVKDINTLGGFVRRSKMYEGNDDAMAMVETGRSHCDLMRKGLKTIAGKRGYHTYKENWEPSEITEMETDTSVIRGMFMDKKVNQRTEDALPLLARLQHMATPQIREHATHVTTADIHGDFFKECYERLTDSQYQAVLSESPEHPAVKNMLDSYTSDLVTVGDECYYVSLMYYLIPEEGFVFNIGYFGQPEKLIAIGNNNYVFKINGEERTFPSKSSKLQHIFLTTSHSKIKQLYTYLKTKYNNVSKKIIEQTHETKMKKDNVGETASATDFNAKRAGAGQLELHTAADEMKEVNEFSQWANQIVEGLWAFPDNERAVDDLNAFMATEQPVGIDAINATDALHDIFGSDTLFDNLAAAANDDPSTDARGVVKDHINNMYKNINVHNKGTQAIISNLYKAISGGIDEGASDLDYDGDATQLNASANKDMDDYIQKEDVAETTDLNELMQRTNQLLQK